MSYLKVCFTYFQFVIFKKLFFLIVLNQRMCSANNDFFEHLRLALWHSTSLNFSKILKEFLKVLFNVPYNIL